MTEEEKKKYRKEYYSKHRESALAKAKIYRDKNKENIRNYHRSYRKKYYWANRDKILKNGLSWRKANAEKVKGYLLKYKEANKEKIAARDKAWKKAHRKQISANQKKRESENLNLRIKKRLRSRVCHSVKRQSGKKAKVTMELLGCSIASFRIYIESKFEPGMTWENIHLDHIVPCALFDLTKPEHQKRCFHFSNYQPLFAKDNNNKRSRLFHGPDCLHL